MCIICAFIVNILFLLKYIRSQILTKLKAGVRFKPGGFWMEFYQIQQEKA